MPLYEVTVSKTIYVVADSIKEVVGRPWAMHSDADDDMGEWQADAVEVASVNDVPADVADSIPHGLKGPEMTIAEFLAGKG